MNTRTALLDSAESAARSRGFDAFSYADLARDVGIRKASIHHHFPVKADLAFGLIERYAARFFETLEEIDGAQPTGAERLRAYLDIYRNALAGGSQLCLCVAFSSGRDSFSSVVVERLNTFHADSIAWLNTVFETGNADGSITGVIDPRAEAHATLALMEGAQLIARAAQDVSLFDQSVAALLVRLSQKQTH